MSALAAEVLLHAVQPQDMDEVIIPVGALSVRMITPRTPEQSSERLSFWWEISNAETALSRYLESMGHLHGRSVVELGCGLGLAGITSGLLGARVTFTDCVPDALEMARRNCRLNGLSEDRCGFALVDWEEPADFGTFSLVLGAEVVYDYFFHGPLVDLLGRIVEPDGQVLLADRKRLCASRFIGRMTNRGFTCRETGCRSLVQGFADHDLTIFTLTRLGE